VQYVEALFFDVM